MWRYFLVAVLLHSTFSEDQTAENVVIDAVDDTLKVGQKVKEKPNKKPFNITEHRLISKQTPDGRPYAVYDDIIPAKYRVLVKKYLTYNTDAWLFNNYDAFDDNQQRTHDNSPWINDQDPLLFKNTKLCNRLLKAVRDTSKDDGPYYPYRVFGKIIRRGDHTLVSADSNDAGDFSAMIFVNEFWKKNYYGELYLYDRNREIIGGATHKPGRVVVWEGTMYRLNRPPSVQFLQGQVIFQVQFSKDEKKMEEGHQNYLKYKKERKEAYKDWVLPDYKLPNGEPFTVRDPEKHKTFEYTTKTDGRKIFVYDDVFPEDLLNRLRSFVLKHGSYFYDDSVDSTSDNVQWVAGFLLNPYIKSPYWKIIKTMAAHATGSSIMFPYDVSINLVRSSDHTRIHGDVGYYGEEEFTCLVYMNPNWTRNYYGETTFFEKNSDDTEIVAQVRPRYGRLVIFDGNIPHSARPPSFNFTGARLTFVTKLHKNEFTGRKKNFQEEMRHFGAAYNDLGELDRLNSRRGNAIAKAQLDQLKKMKTKMAYHPNTEEGEDEDQEKSEGEQEGDQQEEGEEENEMKGEQNGDGGMAADDDSMPPPIPNEDNDPILTELDDFDEETAKMLAPLSDVTSKTPDAVDTIIKVHQAMRDKQDEVKQAYGEKLLSVM